MALYFFVLFLDGVKVAETSKEEASLDPGNE